MGPVGYFIAILGCADGSAACQPIATLATRYENQALCVAATADALSANSDLDFPTLVAECRPAKAKASAAKPAKQPESARPA